MVHGSPGETCGSVRHGAHPHARACWRDEMRSRQSARAVGTSGHAPRGLTRSRPDPAAAKSYMPLRTLPSMPCMPLSYMLCVLLRRNEPGSDLVLGDSGAYLGDSGAYLGDSGAYPVFEGRLGCVWKRISIRRPHGVQGPASNGLESQRSLGFFLGVLASVSLGDDGRVAARERC